MSADVNGERAGTAPVAAATGTWAIKLPPQRASLTAVTINLTLFSSTGVALAEHGLSGVMFGRILLCGGQSNMQFDLHSSFNGSTEVAAAGRYSSTIRLLTVARVAEKAATTGPGLPKLNQPWSVASPATVWDGKSFGLFSAECWLVGTKMVQAAPTVPVGLVSSCWSGSMIQPWLPADAASEVCPGSPAGPSGPFASGQYYNAMIAPLAPLTPAAVIWHQGEENSGDPIHYRCLFPAMITAWRRNFAYAAMPFVFVQLAPCGVPPSFRHAQMSALQLPAVAMAVAFDLGDFGQYHTYYMSMSSCIIL